MLTIPGIPSGLFIVSDAEIRAPPEGDVSSPD